MLQAYQRRKNLKTEKEEPEEHDFTDAKGRSALRRRHGLQC